ncbi:MAG: YfcE family phosphodiesterase [Eubacteriales bacterium]|nr:YfcE family phosphodiesterase [Eubacteriales bacterium]
MKRHLLVSDTHGNNTLLAEILKNEGPFDSLIFLGDGDRLENSIFSMAGCPADVTMVEGNNDYGSSLPASTVIKLGVYRVYLTHGHRERAYFGLDTLSYRASENMCDMCFFGHLHVPLMENIGGVLLVNPGSLSRPRQMGGHPTCIIIEEDERGELSFIQKTY